MHPSPYTHNAHTPYLGTSPPAECPADCEDANGLINSTEGCECASEGCCSLPPG